MSSMTVCYVTCPHCDCFVEIVAVNCAIFRHGVYKATKEQVNPHASKEVCDALVASGQIEGCGRPFRIFQEDGCWKAVACDYV